MYGKYCNLPRCLTIDTGDREIPSNWQRIRWSMEIAQNLGTIYTLQLAPQTKRQQIWNSPLLTPPKIAHFFMTWCAIFDFLFQNSEPLSTCNCCYPAYQSMPNTIIPSSRNKMKSPWPIEPHVSCLFASNGFSASVLSQWFHTVISHRDTTKLQNIHK
jgi:hypothetical protein